MMKLILETNFDKMMFIAWGIMCFSMGFMFRFFLEQFLSFFKKERLLKKPKVCNFIRRWDECMCAHLRNRKTINFRECLDNERIGFCPYDKRKSSEGNKS